ncbi:MAG: hypothetical protein Kow002_02850 [Anaerolineales bacterium]
MKKTILIALTLAAAATLLLAGAAFAQGENPPFGRGPSDGTGTLHAYMEKAMADAVGLSVEAFEARHDAGETFYQIAIAEGFAADEVPALMAEARNAALDAAAKDGVISQEQADWMKSRGFGRGGRMHGYGNGYADGTCPMYGDGSGYQGYGPGMMNGDRGNRGGGRWGTQSQ